MLKKRRTSAKVNEKTVNIDPVMLVSVIVTVIMRVFSFVSITKIVTSFFGVSRFEIIGGDGIYEASDLAAGAGIKRGDKLYRLDEDVVEKRLLENCAYLEKVKIKRLFPNKIKFVVECHDPVWYVEISGDFYILDDKLNVLEETSSESVPMEMDLIKLTLPRVREAIVNRVLTFGDGEEEISETKKIMETILSSEALGMISSADIDNRYAINFEFDKVVHSGNDGYLDIDEVFKVSVGGYSKLDVKLEYIVKALLNEDLEGAVGGTIDVSDLGNRVSIRPSYTPSLPDEEENIGTEENETKEEETLPPDNETPGVVG